MADVNTAEELGQAIKNNESTIHIKGSLADQTISLRATGAVSWAIAFGAIGIAAGSVLLAVRSRNPRLAAGIFAAPAAVAILGTSVTSIAIAIVKAAGDVSALAILREYKEARKGDGLLVLERR